MLDATVIAAVFAGLSGVLVAWAQMRNQRSGVGRTELRQGRAERKRLEDQMLAIRRWAIKLRELAREHNLPRIPAAPPQFDLDWGREEDEEDPKSVRPMRLVGR